MNHFKLLWVILKDICILIIIIVIRNYLKFFCPYLNELVMIVRCLIDKLLWKYSTIYKV